MRKTKSLHSMTIEGCKFTTQLQYNTNTDHIGIITNHQDQSSNKYMRKIKSIHTIMIEGCQFATQLFYNINTDHIGIYTSYHYQNFDNKKQYYINNKEKFRQRHENNCDPNTVRKGSDEWKIKMSCAQRKIFIKDFDGFTHKQKYCPKFNDECREINRIKYDRKCFICGKDEIENNRKLSVHHVDMNKNQGCDSNWSLIPVCGICHNKIHNKLWEARLSYLLENDEKLYKV